LTAAHLLANVGSDCRVRAKRSFGEVDTKVVWKAEKADIALLELPKIISPCQPVVLGRLPEANKGEKLPFEMQGYPLWGRTQRDKGKTAAGDRHIDGWIYLADRSPDDLLVLEAGRLPPEKAIARSEWEGLSGAAVICRGLVIAVQSRHQNPRRPAALEADPLFRVCDDEQWCALLRRHGIRPELEIVALSQEQIKQSLPLSRNALPIEPDKPRQANYTTPYGMTIVRTGTVTSNTGIFQFLIRNFNRIAAIFAHIDNEDDWFMDYVSRGEKPVYTFVLKGKGFTDFEFIHVATDGSSLFEECLTLLVLDFKHHHDKIRFDVVHADQFEEKWGRKSIGDYVPSLDEMARAFFQDESYFLGGGGGKTSYTWDLGWEADSLPYNGLEISDTRFIDYSHMFVGLKSSSLETKKYGVGSLIRSGVLVVDRDVLHHRYRCMCDGWTEERQDLDFYELGCIFGQHFGYKASFSPASFLAELDSHNLPNKNATVYVEKGKRIEVLPMEWSDSWFTYYVDGKASNQGWSLLFDDPNPFKLYDMNDFFPKELEQYKQRKK